MLQELIKELQEAQVAQERVKKLENDNKFLCYENDKLTNENLELTEHNTSLQNQIDEEPAWQSIDAGIGTFYFNTNNLQLEQVGDALRAAFEKTSPLNIITALEAL